MVHYLGQLWHFVSEERETVSEVAMEVVQVGRRREIFMNQGNIVKKMVYTAKSEFNRIKDQVGNPKFLFWPMGSLLQTKRLPTLPKEQLGKLLN